MLKKLIFIENGVIEQFNTLSELVRSLIDENFYNMNEEERVKIMEKKALKNCLNTKKKVTMQTQLDGDIEDKFIIKDEITYILSLLTTNKVQLLEKKDRNDDIFTKGIEVKNPKNNYIIVNKYANQLLKKYLKSKETIYESER